jgi:hypothetical protein
MAIESPSPRQRTRSRDATHAGGIGAKEIASRRQTNQVVSTDGPGFGDGGSCRRGLGDRVG